MVAFEILKDVRDMDGDEQVGYKSIPLRFGIIKANTLSLAFLLGSLVPALFLTRWGAIGIVYCALYALTVLAPAVITWLTSKGLDYARREHRALRFGWYTGLIPLLLFV
jgi:4-hydroxybenzoate polyprenyltransferase